MNGWYYDKQLENPLTSVSLHPNQVLDNETGKWKDIEDGGDDEKYVMKGGQDRGCGYSKTPIARAILQEDFNVSIANRWTAVGDNSISELWNQARTVGPYVPVAKDMLSIITKAAEDQSAQSAAEGNKVTSKLTEILGTVSKLAEGGVDLLSSRINDSLIIQGSRFTYYSGSGVAFGNLGLRYTIFPIFDSETGKMISTIDQVAKILPYVNGNFEESSLTYVTAALKNWANTDEGLQQIKEKAEGAGQQIEKYISTGFQKIDDALTEIRKNRGKTGEEAKSNLGKSFESIKDTAINYFGVKNEAIKSIAADTMAKVDEYFHGLISWQKAPGGYQPSYKDIDAPQQGTLKLKIGTQYSISSLLCQDITMNFSKVMAKDPKTLKLSPLYCDINLTLTPSTMYSNRSLEKFISAGVDGKLIGPRNFDPTSFRHIDNLQKQQEYLRRNYNV